MPQSWRKAWDSGWLAQSWGLWRGLGGVADSQKMGHEDLGCCCPGGTSLSRPPFSASDELNSQKDQTQNQEAEKDTMSLLQHQGKMELFSTNYLILNLSPIAQLKGRRIKDPKMFPRTSVAACTREAKHPETGRKS